MSKKKIISIFTVSLATIAMPTVLIGCSNYKEEDKKVSGGSDALFGQVGKSGRDTKSWRLISKGQILNVKSYKTIGADASSVTISNAGVISWDNNLSKKDYRFKVEIVDENNNKYESCDIVLKIGPAVTTFANDGWAVVGWWANVGLDALHSVYAADCSNNTAFPGTLIGLERTILLNGLNHRVKVVGENHDRIDDTHRAALTFQIVQAISRPHAVHTTGLAFYIEWEKRGGTNYDFWHSTLNNALNGTNVQWEGEKDNHLSVIEMINAGNPDLTNYIKAVKRTVNTVVSDEEDPPTFVSKEESTKIFCPAISSYYSKKGIEDTNIKTIPENYRQLYYAEDIQYEYYHGSDQIGDHWIEDDAGNLFAPDCLKFECTTPAITECPSWTCSIYLWDGEDMVWNLTKNGELDSQMMFLHLTLVPLFCI